MIALTYLALLFCSPDAVCDVRHVHQRKQLFLTMEIV